MKQEILDRALDQAAENRRLKALFAEMELNPGDVCPPGVGTIEQENQRLRHLLDWACTYRRSPSRRALERMGYRFPPVEPDCAPDSDWIRFERWMQGRALSWSLRAEALALPEAAALDDAQLERVYAGLIGQLTSRNVAVDIPPQVPIRLVYAYLRTELAQTDFEFVGPRTVTHLTGCGGACEECFQKPWCEVSEMLAQDEGDDAEPGDPVSPRHLAVAS
jgi:hypothetical protein